MSDMAEGIPHAEDTFEAGYAAAARMAARRSRPRILREAATACFAAAYALPRWRFVRRRQAVACGEAILRLIEADAPTP